MKSKSEALFSGSIQHTENTIELLFKTQYDTYEKPRILARMLIGFVLAVFGFLSGFPTAVKGIMLLIGCWLLVSKDFPAGSRADRAIQARKGNLPRNVCTFFNGSMELTGEGAMKIPYNRFQKLVEDDAYLYLFLEKKSLCMIDKNTVTGGSVEDLKAFVEKKSSLPWIRNRSLLSMTGWDLLQAIKNRRQR